MTGSRTIRLDFFQMLTNKHDWISMPSATTGYRAAQRCAEFVGLDPEQEEYEWQLATHPAKELIPPDEVIESYDGRTVLLLKGKRRD